MIGFLLQTKEKQDGRCVGAWPLENGLNSKSVYTTAITNNNSSPTASVVPTYPGRYSIGQFDTNKNLSCYSALNGRLTAKTDASIDVDFMTTNLGARNTFMSWTRSGLSENGWSVETDGTLNFWLGGPASAFRCNSSAGVITTNTWYHLHIYFTGGNAYMWVGNTLVGSTNTVAGPFTNLVSMQWGQYTLGGDYLKGYVKNIRYCVPGMKNPNPA